MSNQNNNNNNQLQQQNNQNNFQTIENQDMMGGENDQTSSSMSSGSSITQMASSDNDQSLSPDVGENDQMSMTPQLDLHQQQQLHLHQQQQHFFNDHHQNTEQQQQHPSQQETYLQNELQNLQNIIGHLSQRILNMESDVTRQQSQISTAANSMRDPTSIIFPTLSNNQSLESFCDGVIRAMADTAPFFLWMSGLDGQSVYFNKRWLEFTGRTLDEDIGDGWTELVHSEDLVRIFSQYMESFHLRKSFKLEYRLRRHDGVYRWLIDTGSPRYSQDGQFLGYVGSCIDITEMWHSKHEIRTFFKQQESLLNCSMSLTTDNNLNNIIFMDRDKQTNPKLLPKPKLKSKMDQQQEGRFSGELDEGVDEDKDMDIFERQRRCRNEFFKTVLKTLTYSVVSNGSILFIVDPENPLLLRIGQKYNVNIDKDYVIQLPRGFWDEISIAKPVYEEREVFFEEVPSSPLEANPFTEMLRRIDESNNRPRVLPATYSNLYQNHVYPLLYRLGLRSITSEFIPSTHGGPIPYGFLSVGTTLHKEYTTIDQHTIKVMSNIVATFISKQAAINTQLAYRTISHSIANLTPYAMVTVDHHGHIVEMNNSTQRFIDITSNNNNNNNNMNDILTYLPQLNGEKIQGHFPSFKSFIEKIIKLYINQHQNNNNNQYIQTSIQNTPTTPMNIIDLTIKSLANSHYLFIFIESQSPLPIFNNNQQPDIQQQPTTTTESSQQLKSMTLITNNTNLSQSISNIVQSLQIKLLIKNSIDECNEEELIGNNILFIDHKQLNHQSSNIVKSDTRSNVLLVPLDFIDHFDYFSTIDAFLIVDPLDPNVLVKTIHKQLQLKG